MKKFRFRDWRVYQDAQRLFSLAMKIVKELPKEHRFDIGNQLIRASLSVILNIAEGSAKSSDKELNRYFEISLGSLYETLAIIDAVSYHKLARADFCAASEELISLIADQLGGFKKKLNTKL